VVARIEAPADRVHRSTADCRRTQPGVVRRAAAAFVLIALALASSIDEYYVQSVGGQLELLRKTRSISDVIVDDAVPDAVRERLALVREIREFAVRELGLPDSASYSRFVDVGREFVVWNVFAAPRLSTEPARWCFPVAGCVAYRGYFQREQAMAFADARRAEGYDVFVGGVRAYSTLGWFDDPVLSTYLHYSDANLASLIFHELAHEMYYLGGDTVFNESFATTVAREGTRRWLAARGESDLYERARQLAARNEELLQLILAYRARLQTLYASEGDAAAKLDLKGELLKDLRQDYDELRARLSDEPGPLRLLPQHPNNAYLAAVGSYNAMVPAFEALLRLYDGNLAEFYDAVRALGGLPRTQRDLRVAELSTPAVEATASSQETPAEDHAQEG